MKRFVPLLPFAMLAACGGGTDAADENAATPEPVAQVRTATVSEGTSSDSVSVYGATEAGPGSGRSLVAPAEAVIASIAAPAGTAVGAGQVIVTLTPSPATRAAAAKAASDTGAAGAAYQRALRLRRDGLVSDADVETARAALASARATSANLGIGGGGLALRAPIAGTVQGLTAKVGDQVAAGAAVATIGAQGDLRARFGVDPVVAQRIRPGQPLTIDAPGGAARSTVTVVGVDPQIDPTTRLASVYARVPAALHLGAGEPLRATVAVGATRSGITIPYAALLDDGGRSYVFVVKDGIAKEQDVSPGNSAGDRIQVLKGLQPGDRVVTEGGTALEDGMKVTEQGAGAAK